MVSSNYQTHQTKTTRRCGDAHLAVMKKPHFTSSGKRLHSELENLPFLICINELFLWSWLQYVKLPEGNHFICCHQTAKRPLFMVTSPYFGCNNSKYLISFFGAQFISSHKLVVKKHARHNPHAISRVTHKKKQSNNMQAPSIFDRHGYHPTLSAPYPTPHCLAPSWTSVWDLSCIPSTAM